MKRYMLVSVEPYLSVTSQKGSEQAGAAAVLGPSWSGSEVPETLESRFRAIAGTWVVGTLQDQLAPSPQPPGGHPSTLQQTHILVGKI